MIAVRVHSPNQLFYFINSAVVVAVFVVEMDTSIIASAMPLGVTLR